MPAANKRIDRSVVRRVASSLVPLRQKRGLTQGQLADKTGLSVDTIGAIEQGRRWARLTTLHKLAKGLGVSTDELFKGVRHFLV